MATAELLVYRTDMLGEAGIEPPRTTDALVAAARRLHDPARGISGIAWNGGRGTPVGHTFIMIMSAFGRPILDLRRTSDGFDGEQIVGEAMRPAFLSPEARETAAYLQELKARDTVHHVFEASVVNIADARPCNEIIDCQWYAYGAVDELDTTDATRHIVKSFLRRL